MLMLYLSETFASLLGGKAKHPIGVRHAFSRSHARCTLINLRISVNILTKKTFPVVISLSTTNQASLRPPNLALCPNVYRNKPKKICKHNLVIFITPLLSEIKISHNIYAICSPKMTV